VRGTDEYYIAALFLRQPFVAWDKLPPASPLAVLKPNCRPALSVLVEDAIMATWSLSPYLRAQNAAEAIDWYIRALGAVEKERYEMDGKIQHAELDVHGNVLCLADTSEPEQFARPRSYNDVPITLYAIVPDVDAVFNRAVEAGALVDRVLTNQEYGYRNGSFIDPYGHVWFVSTPIAELAASTSS
jgi:PhnB protein